MTVVQGTFVQQTRWKQRKQQLVMQIRQLMAVSSVTLLPVLLQLVFLIFLSFSTNVESSRRLWGVVPKIRPMIHQRSERILDRFLCHSIPEVEIQQQPNVISRTITATSDIREITKYRGGSSDRNKDIDNDEDDESNEDDVYDLDSDDNDDNDNDSLEDRMNYDDDDDDSNYDSDASSDSDFDDVNNGNDDSYRNNNDRSRMDNANNDDEEFIDTSLINAVINDPDVRIIDNDGINDDVNQEGESESDNNIASSDELDNDEHDKDEYYEIDTTETSDDITEGSSDYPVNDASIVNEDVEATSTNSSTENAEENDNSDNDISMDDIVLHNNKGDTNNSDVGKSESSNENLTEGEPIASTEDSVNSMDHRSIDGNSENNDSINDDTINQERNDETKVSDDQVLTETVSPSTRPHTSNGTDIENIFKNQQPVHDEESSFVLNETTRTKLMKELYYTKKEIDTIQPQILQTIIQHNLYRPQEGIPVHWLIEPPSSSSSSKTARTGIGARQIIVKRMIPVVLTAIGYAIVTASTGTNPSTKLKSMLETKRHSVMKRRRSKPPTPRPPTITPPVTTIIQNLNTTSISQTIDSSIESTTNDTEYDDTDSLFPQRQQEIVPSQTIGSIRPATTKGQQLQKAITNDIDVTWLDKLITRIENAIKNSIRK